MFLFAKSFGEYFYQLKPCSNVCYSYETTFKFLLYEVPVYFRLRLIKLLDQVGFLPYLILVQISFRIWFCSILILILKLILLEGLGLWVILSSEVGVFKSKSIQKNQKPHKTDYYWTCLNVILWKPLGLDFRLNFQNQTKPNTYI